MKKAEEAIHPNPQMIRQKKQGLASGGIQKKNEKDNVEKNIGILVFITDLLKPSNHYKYAPSYYIILLTHARFFLA